MVEREPEHDPEEQLSPELVLVSPELRERALREEREAPPPPQADEARAAPAPPEPPSPASAAPPPPPAEAAAAQVEGRRTARAVTAIALVALLLFGAGVAVGKLAFRDSGDQAPVTSRAASPRPPAGTAPPARTSTGRPTTTLRATSTSRPSAVPRSTTRRSPVTAPRARTSTSKSTTTLRATSTSRSPAPPRSTSPRRPVTTARARTSPTTSTTRPARQPKPSTASPRTTKTPPTAVRPTPNGGYVFSDGRFRVSGNGRTILSFTLGTTCAGQVTLPPIQVAESGAFTFSGRVPGAPPGTTVDVAGRFVSPAAAGGTVRVTRGTCHAAAKPFSARLS